MKLKMHKKLILECFEKAKSETDSGVLSSLSKHISEVLLEDCNFQVNERTLRNYYNEMENEGGKNLKISTSIANELAKYIGYKSLRDYSKSIKSIKKKKSINKVVIGSLIVVVSYFGYETT